MKTVAVVAVLQLNSAGCFMIFLPQNGLDIAIFPIFAPAKSGEIDLARESSSLYSILQIIFKTRLSYPLVAT